MKIKNIFSAISILLLVNASTVYAQELPNSILTTAALWATSPNMFTCSLTNITTVDHTVMLRIYSQGNLLKEKKMSLPARTTSSVDMEGFTNGGYMYCEFTVEGQKAWYRGLAKLYRSGGDDFIAIPAY